MNFIYGLKSLIRKPTRYKFLGLLIPVFIMIYLSINRQMIYLEYPVAGVITFYLAIPVYVYVLGLLYKAKADNKNELVEIKSKNENHIGIPHEERVYNNFEMYEEIITNQQQGIKHEKRVYFRDMRK